MSWSTYLVDADRKVLVECGRITEEDMLAEIDAWKGICNDTFEREGVDLYRPLAEACVQDIAKLLEAEKLVSQISGLQARFLALDYARLHLESATVIGEEEAEKYIKKGYKLI